MTPGTTRSASKSCSSAIVKQKPTVYTTSGSILAVSISQTAINSMFRWYRNAVKCYVCLSEVSALPRDGQSPQAVEWESAFRKSRWFTRGWTLQELLAPKTVEFYSREGVRLGDKKSLEQEIHEITGIAVGALHGHHLNDFGVDERLKWRETRQTTEEEDLAYSLIGIFDISMPLVYGEGHKTVMKRLLREMEDSSFIGTQSLRNFILHWVQHVLTTDHS
jgi:hypothetical protein